MKIEDKTIYICEYCKKYSVLKRVISRHEKLCKNNPVNKHKCFGCVFLKKETEFDEVDYTRHTYFICKKRNVPLRTYKTEHYSLLKNRYGHLELMPNECDLFDIYDGELDIF